MVLQIIHKKVSSLPFIALLAVLMVFVTVESKARALDVMSYSAEALFDGIFFAEGEVADRIPELKGLNAKNYASTAQEQQKIDDARTAIKAHVKESHPNFMNELKAAVDSRSHVAIDRVIVQGRSIMEEAANVMPYERNLQAEQEFQQRLEGRIQKGMSAAELNSAIQSELDNSSRAMGYQACLAVFLVLILFLIKLLVIPFVAAEGDFFHESMVNSITKL
jgi:SdpC family antimicrobial peptide